MLQIRNSIWILIISALIATVPFFVYQYVHQTIQAGTCPMNGVNSQIFWEQWGFNARCTNGPPNENLFELSGGIILSFIAFSIAAICLFKGHKIGLISSVAVACDQIVEAYIQNNMGYMYNMFEELLPALHILVMLGIVYLAGKIVLSRPTLKLNIDPLIPAIVVIIVGTVAISFSMYHFLQPQEPTAWVHFTGQLSAALILLLIGNYLLHKKLKELIAIWQRTHEQIKFVFNLTSSSKMLIAK